MFKALTLIICVFFWVKGHAFTYEMNHEKFVHLASKDKEALIIQVMEMMVQLEKEYELEVLEEGPNKQLQEEYSRIWNKLQSILIESAYAKTVRVTDNSNRPERDWDYYANAAVVGIKSESAKANKDRCFYAGWISHAKKVYTTQKKVKGQKKPIKEFRFLCSHPLNLPANAPERKAYEQAYSTCKKQNEISCNPAIFGFKNASDKSQFCVAAGREASEDAAHSCMKMALGKIDMPGSDSVQDRINLISRGMEQKPDYVDSIHNFILKKCLCDGDTKTIKQEYTNRIRTHRTCYGMLNTVAKTTMNCENRPRDPIDLEIFREINEKNWSNLEGDQVDAVFSEWLSSVKTLHSDSYEAVCLGKVRVAKLPDPVKNYECNVACVKDEKDELADCKYEVTLKDSEAEVKYTVINKEPFKLKDPIKVKLNEDKNQELSCNLLASDKPMGPDPTCVIDLTEPEENPKEKVFAAVVSLTPLVDYESVKWTPKSEPESTEPYNTFSYDKEKVPVKAVIKLKGREKTIECSTEFVPLPPKAKKEEAAPELKVEDGKLTVETKEAKATLNGKTELVPGYSIVWYNQDKKSVSKKTIEVAPDGDATEEVANTASSAVAEIAKDKFSVDQKRELNDYKVCAKLIKSDGSETGQNGCVNVPKLDEKEPIVPPPPAEAPKKKRTFSVPQVQPMAPAPPRVPFNTSAQGIR